MKFKGTFGIIGGMIAEAERVRFRTGESRNKPYGGNIADNPFSQTLYKLASSQGFESQKSLARALDSRQNLVSSWYRGISFPSPKLFGRLLVVLDLTDEEREPLVELYAQKLASEELERKGAYSSLKISRRMIHPSDNPMGKWFENLCEEKGLTLSQGSEKFKSSGLLLRRHNFSLKDLDFIYKNAKDAFSLSEDELAILAEAIEKEKQYRAEKGHRFQIGPIGMKVVEEQKKLSYPTWNGEQAGAELGITREGIRQLRKKFGFPVLLTEDHIKQLKSHHAIVEERREKQKSGRAA